tara:strand:- start:9237 stop:9722 length:486 start_codon:yes stop_codon:yes gene_type:complete
MKITFTIDCPPFSVNKAYYKNRQLTQEARKWRENFLYQLQCSTIQKDLQSFREAFHPQKNGIRAVYTFYYPSSLLLTKRGEISRRSCDLTNIEKLVQDNIFDARYNGRVIRDKTIINLNLDDKYITHLESHKRLHPQNLYQLEVCLDLIPLPETISLQDPL